MRERSFFSPGQLYYKKLSEQFRSRKFIKRRAITASEDTKVMSLFFYLFISIFHNTMFFIRKAKNGRLSTLMGTKLPTLKANNCPSTCDDDSSSHACCVLWLVFANKTNFCMRGERKATWVCKGQVSRSSKWLQPKCDAPVCGLLASTEVKWCQRGQRPIGNAQGPCLLPYVGVENED